MTSLPHLYVLPLASPRPRRTCLVCQAQDQLGVAVFVNAPTPAALTGHQPTIQLMRAFGALEPEIGTAFTSIVAQQGAHVEETPEGELIDRIEPDLRAAVTLLTEQAGGRPLRAALAGGVVPQGVPIAPDAATTVLLYRYRQIVDVRPEPARGTIGTLLSVEDEVGRLRAFIVPHLLQDGRR